MYVKLLTHIIHIFGENGMILLTLDASFAEGPHSSGTRPFRGGRSPIVKKAMASSSFMRAGLAPCKGVFKMHEFSRFARLHINADHVETHLGGGAPG